MVFKLNEGLGRGGSSHLYSGLNEFRSVSCNILSAYYVNDIKYGTEIKLAKALKLASQAVI